MFTNAPNAVTFVTIPGKIIPTLKSLIVRIDASNSNTLAVFRGSLPGFFNSFIKSSNVNESISG